MTSTKPYVSIIIVNWNGGTIFKNCLKSLYKLTYSNWELIIVDNGSTDNSDKLPKKLGLKSVRLIKNKKNVGFAQANNQGFKRAQGEYVLFLNNDTEVKPDLLSVLVDKLSKNPEIAVVQPKIYLLDKITHLDTVGSYLTRLGFLEHIGFLEKDSNKFSKEQYIFSAKGACMMTRKKLIDDIGLFDKDYISYFEETDFCWRVWLSGYKIVYCPKTYIFHKVGFSSKKQSQVLVNYHSIKNRFNSLLKNLSLINLGIIGGTHLIILLTLSIYYAIRFRFNYSIMILKAISWNIKNIKSTFTKRHIVQSKIRKKKDNEIFKYILKPIKWKNMFKHFLRSEKMLSGLHEV